MLHDVISRSNSILQIGLVSFAPVGKRGVNSDCFKQFLKKVNSI